MLSASQFQARAALPQQYGISRVLTSTGMNSRTSESESKFYLDREKEARTQVPRDKIRESAQNEVSSPAAPLIASLTGCHYERSERTHPSGCE